MSERPERQPKQEDMEPAFVLDDDDGEELIEVDAPETTPNKKKKGPWRRVLRAEEEVELAKTIEVGVAAQHLLDMLGTFDTLPEEPLPLLAESTIAQYRSLDELRADLDIAAQEGDEARTTLFVHNIGLAGKEYQLRYSRKLREAEAEAFVNAVAFRGLERAIAKFDYTMGYKFSTYATWWIRQAATCVFAEENLAIPLDPRMHARIVGFLNAQSDLKRELGRYPTDKEVAKKTGSSMWVLETTKQAAALAGMLSLNAPVGDTAELQTDLVEEGAVEVDEALIYRQEIEALHEAVQSLPPKYRDLLLRKFGFTGDRETMVSIAKSYAVAYTTVLAWERKALAMLAERMAAYR